MSCKSICVKKERVLSLFLLCFRVVKTQWNDPEGPPEMGIGGVDLVVESLTAQAQDSPQNQD